MIEGTLRKVADELDFSLLQALGKPITEINSPICPVPSDNTKAYGFNYGIKSTVTALIITKDGVFFTDNLGIKHSAIPAGRFLPKCNISSIYIKGEEIEITTKSHIKYNRKSSESTLFGEKIKTELPEVELQIAAMGGRRRKTKRAKKNKRRTRRS